MIFWPEISCSSKFTLMKRNDLIILFFLLLQGTISALDITFPPLDGFRKSEKYPVYTPDNLWDFIDGAADGFLSLGFIDLHIAEYKKGKESIKAEIYRHSDHTNAFGIYSSERSPDYNFISIGAQGYSIEGSLNFFKGNYYVKIRTFSEKAKTINAVRILASRIEMMLEGENEMPSMITLFPEEGRKKNEETYINESVLGHSYLNKAFKAIYQVGSDVFSVYLLRFPSPVETFKTASVYLTSAGVEPAQSETGKYAFSDGYNGTIFLAWKDDLMVIISDLARDQSDIADRYTSEILK
jgi:hypothetical protein